MASDSVVGILLRAKNEASGPIGEVKDEIASIDNESGWATSALSAMTGALTLAATVKVGQQAFEIAKLGAEAQRVETSFDRMASSIGASGNAMLEALRKASRGAISDKDLELEANRAKVLGVADSVDKLSTLLDIARVRGAAFGRSTKEALDDLVTGLGRGSAQILDNLGFKGGQKDLEDYAASVHKTVAELSDAEKQAVLFNKVVRETKSEVDAAKGSADDSATSFERLAASYQNAREALGKVLAPSVAGGAGGLAGGLDTAASALNAAAAKQQEAIINGLKTKYQELLEVKERAEAGKSGIGFFQGAGADLKALDEQIQQTRKAIDDLERAQGSQISASQAEASAASSEAAMLKNLETAANAAANGQANLKRGVDAATASLDAERGAVLSLAGALPGLQAAVNSQIQGALSARNAAVSRIAGAAAGVEGIVGQTEATRQFGLAVDEVDAKYAALNAQVASGTISTDEFQLKIAELGNTGGDAFEQIRRAQQEADSSAKHYANTVENDIKRAYDSVQSKVDSVVKGALSNIAGVNPAEILRDPKNPSAGTLLPREDEINENARRLADIAVNGFKGQDWLGKFKEAVPDIFKALEESGDPRAAAAQLLKNFQDGLEPELIDKEKAKERVRKMLLGEAKMSELVKEITDELAQETGGDSGQISVLAKATLGVSGSSAKDVTSNAGESGTQAGAAFAASAVAAVHNVGGQMASDFGEQINNALGSVKALVDKATAGGSEAGAAFGRAAAAAISQIGTQAFGATGAQGGAAFSKAAVDAVSGVGDKLIDSLEAQLKADNSVARLKAAGGGAGQLWGQGFLDAAGNDIPNALIDILFGKLVQRFNAYNQQQAQLTGATP
ncbi:MAG: hypothetical protein U0350_36390 [Caldilineaceae bacterium]